MEDESAKWGKRLDSNQLQHSGGTNSIDMFNLLLGLVPCDACLPSPSYFFPKLFPFHSSCCPPLPIPLVWFSSTPPDDLPPAHSFLLHPRWMNGASYIDVPHPRSILSCTVRLLQGPPRTTFSPWFSAVDTARSKPQTLR